MIVSLSHELTMLDGDLELEDGTNGRICHLNNPSLVSVLQVLPWPAIAKIEIDKMPKNRIGCVPAAFFFPAVQVLQVSCAWSRAVIFFSSCTPFFTAARTTFEE